MNNHHLTGLTDAQAAESREKYGSNRLVPPARESVWKMYLEKFQDPIIRILLIAAVLSLVISFVHNNFTEVIGIISAIILATTVSFWFEYDAQRKFDVLNTVNEDTPVRVMRNGSVTEVPKQEIVVGDVVLLEAGEEIPADGELVETLHLSVNESSLTGELSTMKTVNPSEFDKESTYPSNMVLRGTNVMEGHGVMVVKTVGNRTEFGKVAAAATAKSEEKTPLTLQLERLAKMIGVGGFGIAAVTFIALFAKNIVWGGNSHTPGQIGLLLAVMAGVALALMRIWMPIVNDAREIFSRGEEIKKSNVEKWGWGIWILIGMGTFMLIAGVGMLFGVNPFDAGSWLSLGDLEDVLNYFMIAVTLVVVAVPEGLPMSVTLSLALNMRRMLKSNNLVRKMHASETMGAITVICTDKTGTLTENRMRVHEPVFFALPEQKIGNDEASSLITEGISVNSLAHLSRDEQNQPKAIGNPTEAALLLWLSESGTDYSVLRENGKIIDQIAFSTERKYMATMVDSSLLPGKRILYLKGAPEVIFSKSTSVLSDGKEVPAYTYEDKIKTLLHGFQNQAMRTLGFAYKIVDPDTDRCEKELEAGGFVYLGIAAISDPVRPDVADAVTACLNAGIDIKIVTGDTFGTTRQIARQVGLWDDAADTERNHITGADFERLTDNEALERVGELKIMSRARPSDKQRLVQLLQKRGAVVAVTGDGTNDAPALNFAHVGLSMGSGTSVAKEASDITLLDDSFNSIATAVMWGRSLYKNIQRFLLFQLTINVIAVTVVFLGAMFGKDIPLTIVQMLWVNIIMDTFAAAALASLPPSRRVMEDNPRKQKDFIITKQMAINILSVGFLVVALLMGLLWFFEHTGLYPLDYSLSMFFTVFVLIQFWNMFNAKAFDSGYRSAFKGMGKSAGFLTVAALILIGQVIIVSFGGNMFRVVPLALREWLIIIGATSFVLWIGELLRLFNYLKTRKI